MLANELSNRDYNIHIGLRRGGVNLESLNDKINVHYLGDYKIIDPRLFFNILKLVNQIKPDIMQTWLTQMDIIGGIVSIAKLIPWIMTERCSEDFYKSQFLQSRIRIYLANKSNYIIANSKKGIEYFTKNLFLYSNYKVIKNAINIKSIQAKNYHLDTNKKILLSVGRLSIQKNYITIIKAIALLNDDVKNLFELHIFGEGEQKNEIVDLVNDYDLNNIVIFNSYNPNWWGLFKQASALISMSHYEGSPNVVLEAMAGKCPLIVSDIDEHREILSKDSAIFVNRNNSKELANAIKILLRDKNKQKKMVQNSFDNIQSFTLENTASLYEEIYKEILECVA